MRRRSFLRLLAALPAAALLPAWVAAPAPAAPPAAPRVPPRRSRVRYNGVEMDVLLLNMLRLDLDPGASAYRIGLDVMAACPAADAPALRSRLLTPRRPLAYSFGGRDVIDVRAPDAGNGPTPLSCDVKHVHGHKTLLVHFVVEAESAAPVWGA